MENQSDLYKFIRKKITELELNEETPHSIAYQIEEYIKGFKLFKSQEIRKTISMAVTIHERLTMTLCSKTPFVEYLQEALKNQLKIIDVSDFTRGKGGPYWDENFLNEAIYAILEIGKEDTPQ